MSIHTPTRTAPLPITLLLVLACVNLPAAMLPPDSDAQLRATYVELYKLSAKGDLTAALDHFEAAASRAAGTDRAVELQPLLGPDTPRDMTRRVYDIYWHVIPDSRGEQRLRAINDCGVLMIAAGWTDRATEMLARMDGETRIALRRAGGKSSSLFMVNAGIALERAGQNEIALRQFMAALRFDPASREARSGLRRRVAALEAGPAVKLGAEVARRLREGRQLQPAGEWLREAIDRVVKHDTGSAARPLLRELVAYFNAVPVMPATVLAQWGRNLKRLSHISSDEATRELARELVILHDRPQDFRLDDSRWASEHPELTSHLLFRLGQHSENRQPEAAARLYQAAWTLDREHFDAVVYLVNLLGDRGDEMEAARGLLDETVYELFDAKNQAYRAGDLEDIARLHGILGTVYSRQERWGSPDQIDSALFQWQGALQARQQLSGSISPALHSNLAQAYAGASPEQWSTQAFQHYAAAADGYLELDQPAAAETVLDHARRIRPELTTAETRQLQTLDRRVAMVRRTQLDTHPWDDGDINRQLRDDLYQRLNADPDIRNEWKRLDVEVSDGKVRIRGEALENADNTRATIEKLRQRLDTGDLELEVSVEEKPPR